MAEDEIWGKLHKFLYDDVELESEPHAVYLMVELRKLLDHKNIKDKYITLRFFCDWAVHISKDRNMKGISDVIALMEKEVSKSETLSNEHATRIFRFLGMEKLKNEIDEFLGLKHVTLGKLAVAENWKIFSHTLAEVLSGQPIRPPEPTSIELIEINAFDEGSSVDIYFKNGHSVTVGKGIEVV